MDISLTTTSPKNFLQKGPNVSVLEKSLILKQDKSKVKSSILWTFVNVLVLSVLIYDLAYVCPLKLSYYDYAEYAFAVLLSLNILYHMLRIFVISWRREPISITSKQKKLLRIPDNDSSFRLIPDNESPPNKEHTSFNASSLNSTSLNSSVWLSSSPNDSLKTSLSTSWTYKDGSPNSKVQTSPKQHSYLNTLVSSESFKIDPIKDEKDLDDFLKERETFEKINKVHNQSPQSTNLLSSFWRHPVIKNAKDSVVLSKCKYQLSPISRDKSSQSAVNTEDLTQGKQTCLEPWTRINVDSVALTQWNENLRKWISQTILERLVTEINDVNVTLEKHGLNDIKVGEIGLDRLRKAAYMLPVVHLVPSLKTLINFLEVTPNQEYFVKRIRQLSRGGCMSDFKWNGGSSYNGKPWNDSLPTDCAIIMHLLASYLDTQLMPLPSAPDVKPFSGYHYLKFNEKVPKLNDSSIFIQQVSEKPPHYRIIVGERVYEMGKGYNNMFHSILFFLYHVNKINQGMIGRVNLGRAGVNMLWIIDQ